MPTAPPPRSESSEAPGAVLVLIGGDGVRPLMRAGPLVRACRGSSIDPATEGLEPMMSAAKTREVVGVGLARRSTVVRCDVRLHVVDVAATGDDPAVGEDAVAGPGAHGRPPPYRGGVGVGPAPGAFGR